MSRAAVRLAALALLAAAPPPAWASTLQAPSVVEIRLHGNTSIPDEEVLELAGAAVGDPADEEALAAIRARLEDSGRFESVRVERRFRSLTGTEEVVLLIEVVEARGVAGKLLFLPILAGSEEEGFVYGARVSGHDLLGGGEILSLPLTWGGVRRAALEVQRDFGNTRVGGFAQLRSWENPHFELRDERAGGGIWLQRRLADSLWGRVHAERHAVEYAGGDDALTVYGASATLDTRPGMAHPWRGAMASVGWERVDPRDSDAVSRWRIRGAAYRRLGRPILRVAGSYISASGPLPPWERALVGGAGKLRGYEAGRFAGDRAAYGSVELRTPLNSPLAAIRFGVSVFWDVGAAWNAPRTIDEVRFRHGVGVGLYAVSPLGALGVDIGFDLEGGKRIHIGTGVEF